MSLSTDLLILQVYFERVADGQLVISPEGAAHWAEALEDIIQRTRAMEGTIVPTPHRVVPLHPNWPAPPNVLKFPVPPRALLAPDPNGGAA